MKLTKKQILMSSGLAFLLVGGAVSGVLYNQHVQAEKAKQVQEEKKQALENAKQAEKKLIKEAQATLLNAQKAPSTNNLELAQKAISKLKDEQAVKQLTKELEGIKTRVKLEEKAKKAVSDYQKDAWNADKLKKAQAAVSKLTSSYSKALKAKLEKDVATSKAQADKAKKAEEAKKAELTQKAKEAKIAQASAQSDTQTQAADINNAAAPQVENSASNDGAAYNSYTQGTPAPAQNNSGYVASTPSGGNVQTPAQPNAGNTSQPSAGVNRPAGGTSNNNGGSTSTSTPAPAVTYTGWVRRNGVIVWSQGGFATLAEAGRAAAIWMNTNADFDGNYSSGAY